MAFTSDTLSVIVQPIGGTGIRFLSYRSDDSSATITGANYFTRAASFGIQKYDLIFVSPVSGSTTPYIVNISAINAVGDATGVIQQAQPLNANLTTLSAVTPGATGLALLDDTTPAAALTTLGVSAYAQTLLDDADASTALSTLGFSTYGKTLINGADASAAQTTLGISTFVKTILDDAAATNVLTTLGFSTYGKTMIDDADASAAQTTLGISTFVKTILDDADAAAVLATIGAPAITSGTYTPSMAAGSGTLTSTSSLSASWTRIGDLCFVTIDGTVTNQGSGATSIVFGLPFAAASGKNSVLSGGVTSSGGGAQGFISGGGNTVTVFTPTGTFPGATGNALRVSGCYKV